MMQAEATVLQRIAGAYAARRVVRLLCVWGVLGAGALLFFLTGGFPPSAWRLLALALPRLPALLAVHGQATLLALLGLLLLSFTLLLAWGVLLWLCWRMLAYWRYERRELRRFAEDAAQAHDLAGGDAALSDEEEEEEDVWPAMSGSFHRPGARRPLALYSRYPLAPAEPDEALPGWQEEEDAEEEDSQPEGGEAMEQCSHARRLSLPTPGNMSHTPWREHDAHVASLSSLPTQPIRPVSLASLPAGRVVPFVPPVSGHAHPPTGYYRRVPLSPEVAPAPAQVCRPATRLLVSTGLDAGLKRKDRPNEDSLLALQNTRMLHGSACPVGLFVVADGMGGHTNGQEASRLVIQTLSRTVVPSIIYGPTDDNYAELLAEGVHHANLEVYQRNRQEKANMGTTIAAALVIDATVYVVSAGDSRVYLYRVSSGLSQVTRDHSTVARLVENGLILPEDVYTHPRRNEIYRSLGHRPSEDLDRFILALLPEDILLLCSDGLWEMVRDEQIEQIIASTLDRPLDISAALVQAALAGGGKDNISVIAVCLKAAEEAQAAWAAG